MASTYLTKAADNAANQNIFTLSAWLKPSSNSFNGAFVSFAESSVRPTMSVKTIAANFRLGSIMLM